MDTVQRWTGRETQALRHALRMSMRAFANHLGVALRTVAKWEQRAEQIEPRPPIQEALDTALRIAPEDARWRFFKQLEPIADLGVVDSVTADMDTVTSFDEQADELRERLFSAGSVDDAVIALLSTQADHIREVDRKLGASAAVAQLDGHLATLDMLRSFTVTANRRERLAILYSDAAALAGWQRLDQGDPLQAWRRHEVAKDAGREAVSPAALVHAIAQQAYVLVELGETGAAIQLVDHACVTAGTSIPRLLAAWLSAVQGEIIAFHGSDCRPAFEEAARLLPSNPSHPELPYIILDETHLARWRGSALAKLGHAEAITDLSRALEGLDPSFMRARAGLRVDLAHALLAAGQRADAVAELVEAKHLAWQVGSARQHRRIRHLESELLVA